MTLLWATYLHPPPPPVCHQTAAHIETAGYAQCPYGSPGEITVAEMFKDKKLQTKLTSSRSRAQFQKWILMVNIIIGVWTQLVWLKCVESKGLNALFYFMSYAWLLLILEGRQTCWASATVALAVTYARPWMVPDMIRRVEHDSITGSLTSPARCWEQDVKYGLFILSICYHLFQI